LASAFALEITVNANLFKDSTANTGALIIIYKVSSTIYLKEQPQPPPPPQQ
jgi:hypothetical protein